MTFQSLSPKWMVNRSLGYVATLKSAPKGSRRRPLTLEIGSPEFISKEVLFVLKPDEAPAQVRAPLNVIACRC